MEMDEASNPDNSWYGTPRATILQSKRKLDEDEPSPHEETRPRRDKEEQKRRRMEAKAAKKSRKSNMDEKMEVSKPEAPLAAMSIQEDGPQFPEYPSSPPTIISRSSFSSHEASPSGDLVDMQASFRAEGVSMRLSSFFEVKFI